MKKKSSISLSYHSMDSFSLRTNTPILEVPFKMRELWEKTKEITREEVMEIIEDSNIKKLINKKSKYFICDLDECHKGIFVVRDNTCVTFKTTMERSIWQSLNKS